MNQTNSIRVMAKCAIRLLGGPASGRHLTIDHFQGRQTELPQSLNGGRTTNRLVWPANSSRFPCWETSTCHTASAEIGGE